MFPNINSIDGKRTYDEDRMNESKKWGKQFSDDALVNTRSRIALISVLLVVLGGAQQIRRTPTSSAALKTTFRK